MDQLYPSLGLAGSLFHAPADFPSTYRTTCAFTTPFTDNLILDTKFIAQRADFPGRLLIDTNDPTALPRIQTPTTGIQMQMHVL